ncbi:hypothetical protein HanRHA438_Chr01g0043521 [Helianthus annuus]|nr:hypothetical protein HanRHA438_Chr01g0043521 [Helianthus annuus]
MVERAMLMYKIPIWAFDGPSQGLGPCSHGVGVIRSSIDVKVNASIPTMETSDETVITLNEPRYESANMAPRIGDKAMQPLTMFAI